MLAVSKETYVGLDLVRFSAALMVAVYHLAYWGWLPTGMPVATYRAAFTPISGWSRWGNVGVPIFFVLSGFIIAASANGRTCQDFIKGRALRLYPAVWICAVPLLLVQSPDMLTVLRSVVLWPSGPWLSGVFWTLAVEITFYALVAAMLALGVRLWPFGATFGLVGSIFWLTRAADFATGGHAKDAFSMIERTPLADLTIIHGCFFGVGIALWAIHAEGFTKIKACLFLTFVLAGLVSIFSSARYAVDSQGGYAGLTIRPSTIWFAAVLIVVASIHFQPQLWRIFHKHGPAIRMVGLATYPLYLLHYGVGQFLMVRMSSLNPWFALGLALLTVVVMAFVVVSLERWPRAALKALLHPKGRTNALPSLP
jgi:peptidoglycan/LPS O-acetylase OafA/YrhL